MTENIKQLDMLQEILYSDLQSNSNQNTNQNIQNQNQNIQNQNIQNSPTAQQSQMTQSNYHGRKLHRKTQSTTNPAFLKLPNSVNNGHRRNASLTHSDYAPYPQSPPARNMHRRVHSMSATPNYSQQINNSPASFAQNQAMFMNNNQNQNNAYYNNGLNNLHKKTLSATSGMFEDFVGMQLERQSSDLDMIHPPNMRPLHQKSTHAPNQPSLLSQYQQQPMPSNQLESDLSNSHSILPLDYQNQQIHYDQSSQQQLHYDQQSSQQQFHPSRQLHYDQSAQNNQLGYDQPNPSIYDQSNQNNPSGQLRYDPNPPNQPMGYDQGNQLGYDRQSPQHHQLRYDQFDSMQQNNTVYLPSTKPPSPLGSRIYYDEKPALDSYDVEDSNIGLNNQDPDDVANAAVITKCVWGACELEMHTQEALVAHILQDHVGTGKASYICEWRGCSRMQKPFSKRHKIQNHVRIHTGERPFACPVADCGKKFSRQDGLNTHIKTHSSIKPYVCSFAPCGKAYFHSRSLRKHERGHMEMQGAGTQQYIPGRSNDMDPINYNMYNQSQPTNNMQQSFMVQSQFQQPQPSGYLMELASLTQNNNNSESALPNLDLQDDSYAWRPDNVI